jgi:hypothetical protein
MLTKIHVLTKLSRLYAPRIALTVLVGCAIPAVTAAQQPQAPKPAPKRVVSVMGFEDIKRNEKCDIDVGASSVRLKGKTSTVEVSTSSIEDVLTGDDSARLIGGFVGTLTSFAPYESGRFLSLFRKKLDTLTIQYRDTEGGLHGGILSMHPGEAIALKKLIVAAGAHTTVPIDESAKPTASSTGGDQKNSEQKP